MRALKLRGRFFNVKLERYRTLGGFLRIVLVLSTWGRGEGIRSVRWPLVPIAKPFTW